MVTWTEMFRTAISVSSDKGAVRQGCKKINNAICKLLIPYFENMSELEEGKFWVRNIRLERLCSLILSDTESRGFTDRLSLIFHNNAFVCDIRSLYQIYPTPSVSDLYNAIEKRNKSVEATIGKYVNEYSECFERIQSDLERYSIPIDEQRMSVVIEKGLARDIVYRLEKMSEVVRLYEKAISSYHRFIKAQYVKWDKITG